MDQKWIQILIPLITFYCSNNGRVSVTHSPISLVMFIYISATIHTINIGLQFYLKMIFAVTADRFVVSIFLCVSPPDLGLGSALGIPNREINVGHKFCLKRYKLSKCLLLSKKLPYI